jgi:hypothetical protein
VYLKDTFLSEFLITSKENKMDDNKSKEELYAFLRIVNEAKEQAKAEEQSKWKRIIEERQKQTDNDEWVTTKQALGIIQKKSVNTINDWVNRGLIEEPKKIGRCKYWKKSNLLSLFNDINSESNGK